MKAAELARIVRADLGRTRGPLFTAGFGIMVGVAALVFFFALGLGARKVLLGDVFPIDQVQLDPAKTSAGLMALLGGPSEPAGIRPSTVSALRKLPGVKQVYPKLSFRFPAMARGGKEILGHEIGTHEMIGDGVSPSMLKPALAAKFQDPMLHPGPVCHTDRDCTAPDYCEQPSNAPEGRCSKPVPAIVSRYLVELFDHAIAPEHGLPPIAGALLKRAQGIVFTMTLGNSLLGVARQGHVREIKARLVGVSPKAIDLGVTLPLAVVRRWNAEYAGQKAAENYSSVVVVVKNSGDASHAIQAASAYGLVPHDTRARDVSVLISAVLALLVLVASVILLVAALNIAHTFRVLVGERRHEIGLYRALGASAADMRAWMLSLALVVGALGGAAGALAARLAAFVADWRAAVDLPDFPFKPKSFFVFPWWLWLVAMAFAAGFALLGALGPARRAARTDPGQALAGPGA